jgi:hypothetical protein
VSATDPEICHRFIVEDEQYNYISARFPPDAELFGKRLVELVKGAQSM